MKKLLIGLSLLASLPALASSCPSVDEQIKAHSVGLVSHVEVLDAIDCNLNEISSAKSLCNTKIGIKKDNLQHALKAYNVGMITEQELTEARKEVAIQTLNCIN